MKKPVCFFLCLLLTLLCGCTSPKQEQKTLSVVATIFPYYDFAHQIAGEAGTVTMLLSPGGEVHGYEPTLQDLALIERCDVFIYNGGGDDGWVETLLERCNTQGKQIVRCMDFVELLAVGEEEHHHDHKHTHDEADEHVFTTPQNALLIAEGIYQAMITAKPSQREGWEGNYQQLQTQLLELEEQYKILQGATTPLVVADRFPFLYVTHAYNLSYVAAFSGCSANGEADLKTLYQIKTAAQNTSASTVLCTEFSDGKLAQRVAEWIGGEVKRWHSCHNVTAQEWQQQVTYVELMKQNLKVLKEVLDLETN